MQVDTYADVRVQYSEQPLTVVRGVVFTTPELAAIAEFVEDNSRSILEREFQDVTVKLKGADFTFAQLHELVDSRSGYRERYRDRDRDRRSEHGREPREYDPTCGGRYSDRGDLDDRRRR